MFPPAKGKRTGRPRFRNIGNKDGLVDKVVHAIESEVLSGQLTVGTKLPPEREFSESLGVSRPVVREAVRTLVTRGLLETKHGIGTMVRALSRDEIVKPLTLFLRTCGQDVNIEHLHQVRSILEVESAGLAALQRTEEDLSDLVRICDEMKKAPEPRLFALKDSEFHRRLSQTTHNPLMKLLLDSIHDMMAEVRKLVGGKAGLPERVMPTHIRIVECVKARNPEGARRAMSEHLVIALTIQKELIEQRDS
jgi:GntR family transcriptional repressor for pyruvate dehydrogenase complex